mmetsp:Transcript_54338/g.153054  ORF Transcript_54338/g.153054 Transcript_54338/m.153054 type:complete len:206 (+) Transcript_54338:113-730(+)
MSVGAPQSRGLRSARPSCGRPGAPLAAHHPVPEDHREAEQEEDRKAGHDEHLQEGRRGAVRLHDVQAPPVQILEHARDLRRDVLGGKPKICGAARRVGEEGLIPTEFQLQERAEGVARDREDRDPLQPAWKLRVEAVDQHAHLREEVPDHHVQGRLRHREAQEQPYGPHRERVDAEDEVHAEHGGPGIREVCHRVGDRLPEGDPD